MARRESREAWARRVERWQRSGLSARRFAQREGVRAATLSWWRWRLATERPAVRSSRAGRSATRAIGATDFVELIPTPAVAPTRGDTSDFEVELAAGYRVRFAKDFSNEALTRLLDALESRR